MVGSKGATMGRRTHSELCDQPTKTCFTTLNQKIAQNRSLYI